MYLLGGILSVYAVCTFRCADASTVQDNAVLQRLEELERKQIESDAKFQRLEQLASVQSATIQQLAAEKESQIYINKQEGSMGSTSRRQSTGRQAFTVYSNRPISPSAGDIIRFNQALTNEGNGYNLLTGIFTCNQAGMYMFTFFISDTNENGGVWAELRIQGLRQLEAVAESFHLHHDVQGGNTIVTRVREGDQVWIASKYDKAPIPGDDDHRINTFTGVFLYD